MGSYASPLQSPDHSVGRFRPNPPEATETAAAILRFEGKLRELGLREDGSSNSDDDGQRGVGAEHGVDTHRDCNATTLHEWECRPGGDSSSDDDLGLPSTIRKRDDKAATKIQANLRGVRTRKQMA